MSKIVYKFPTEDLVQCIFKNRPSNSNKSPYVADVFLKDEQRTAIAHVPSLHLGNKCVSGAECIMKFARTNNKQRNRVGKDAVGKYGTPKCEVHSCLVKHKNVWIAAHPKIGEDIASKLLSENTIYQPLHDSKIVKCQREVSNVAGTDMRTDFLLTHEDESYSIVEVKSVVDADFDNDEYKKNEVALFPWGKRNQKYNGVKVVSARAIKHISELIEIAKGNKKDEKYPILRACILFVVVRGDCDYFTPRKEMCPLFADKIKEAQNSNVHVLAHRIKWEEINNEMVGIDDDPIHVKI